MTRSRMRIVLAAGALLLLSAGAATASGTPPADPAAVHDGVTVAPASAPMMWLSGPFGRVRGGGPEAPAATPPDGSPLDAWLRAAPLRLDLAADATDDTSLEVISRPLDEAAAVETLSTGARAFGGPSTPGTYVIVATVRTADRGSGQAAWLVDVPDRWGDEAALLEIPAPVAVLSSGAATVSGEAGDGCHLYLCVTTGYLPPATTLPTLEIGVGEPPRVALSDGSTFVAWRGLLRSLADPGSAATRVDGGDGQTTVTSAELDGLAPPHAGEWLLQVRVEYDRERGWQWFSVRLQAGDVAAGDPHDGGVEPA